MDYETIVIGLGAMGSSTVYNLAKRGRSVLGIDQFQTPHSFGSTHGDTRITRLGIGEGEEYVPLVKRSHELWAKIEEESGEQILFQVGGLVIAKNDNPFLSTTRKSAVLHDIEHDNLTNKEVKEQFPVFDIKEESAYYEPTAGYLRPEIAVKTQLQLAKSFGAELLHDKALEWSAVDGRVKLKTTQHEFSASNLLLCCGPWITDMFPEGRSIFKTYRQILYWFPIEKDYESFQKLPVFIWEFGQGPDDYFYGFPAIDGIHGGIKVATENYAKTTSPDGRQHPASEAEIQAMFELYIKEQIPGLGKRPLKTVSCFYTQAPGGRFIIDRHPDSDNVWVVSPCSGHGFKHSAAIGEALACNVIGEEALDLSAFSFDNC